MNDERIERYLKSLRRELKGTASPEAIEERIQETAGHLEESIAECKALGERDPVEAALRRFGSVGEYGKALSRAGCGILMRSPEKKALAWAAAVVFVPILADLGMDFSSWATGSDSNMYAAGIPVTAVLLACFLAASLSVRRILFKPIAAITLGAIAFFGIVGGFSRGAFDDGGTMARGTAWHRSTELATLRGKESKLAMLELGAKAFAAELPAADLDRFRTQSGYLVPTARGGTPESLKKQFLDDRPVAHELYFKPIGSYAEARRTWIAEGPLWTKTVKSAIDADRRWLGVFRQAAFSTWSGTVIADISLKPIMFVFSLVGLLLVHSIGVGIGAVSRRRDRRQVA